MELSEQGLATKKKLLQDTITAKQQMSSWLQSKTETNDYAYMLAQNEDVRKMTHILTQKILNPTPLNSLKSERTNVYIDLGMGISAFWDEMRTKSSVEVENAMILDSVLMNVEAGLDENINPNLRREFLSHTGMSEEQIDTFVSIEAMSEFEQKANNELLTRICQDFNLDIDDPEDAILINNLMQDAIENETVACLDTMIHSDEAQGRHTYEEMYGVSAEELYEAFPPDDSYFNSVELPEYVEEYTMDERSPMYESMVDFQDMLNATVEDNQKELAIAELQDLMDAAMSNSEDFTAEELAAMQRSKESILKAVNEPTLSDADLASLEAYQPPEDDYDLSLNDADLDFMADMANDQQK